MGTIRRRVAAVLRFLDTVAQAPVSGGSLSIRIRQKSPVIRKDDGYVVILEQPGVYSLDIEVSGGGFSPVVVQIDLEEAAAGIRYIYLLPAPGYPFTPGMAVISGTCGPGGAYALRTADSGRYRLMEDLDGDGDVVRIWGIERFLQGQQLLLNQEEKYALVTLTEPDGEIDHGYRIRERTGICFQKGKTKICSAIRISPDERGRFCLAYDRIRGEKETIRFLGEEIFSRGKNLESGLKDDMGNPEKNEMKNHMGKTAENNAKNHMKKDTDIEIDMEVEIWEGRETEIHVGG